MSTDQERRVAGKVVVITGAASGMGRAGAILLARLCCKHGARPRGVTQLGD
jgi:NAD(P)-dependent dehydrogenase (short-subunit alcohol dehydrogenase family)